MSTKKKQKRPKKERDNIHRNRIKVLMDKIGMSQQELADLALNGNKGHLSRIINGQKRQISITTAIKISKILKTPVEEVFIYDESKTSKKS